MSALALSAAWSCSRPFAPEFASESKVYLLNFDLMKANTPDVLYDFKVNRSSGGQPELISTFYQLPPQLSGRVIHALNHDFTECFFGKHFFLPGKVEGFTSLLLRVDDHGKTSYWAWGVSTTPSLKSYSPSYQGETKVVMRQALMRVAPDPYDSTQKKLSYGHQLCFRSESIIDLFHELEKGKFKKVKVPPPEKIDAHVIESLNKEGRSVSQIAALLIGFAGGYISFMLFMQINPLMSEWPVQKKRRAALIAGGWMALLAFLAFSL